MTYDSTILGIETSCDETAAAVVARDAEGHGRILSSVVRAQWEQHRPYGGVVPELAARAHVECLDEIIAAALAEAGIGFGDLSAVAATGGPGLIGGVLVGLTEAKAIALVHDLPLIAVNHLEAHALTPGLTEGLKPPYVLLLVSGAMPWATTSRALTSSACLSASGEPRVPMVRKGEGAGDCKVGLS